MTKREEAIIKSQLKDFLEAYNVEDDLRNHCDDRNFTELYTFLFED